MKSQPSSKVIATMSVMTALVYAMTAISIPMPKPLGVWHLGDIASFVAAIFCGPLVGGFACGVGAMLFDIWNPLWGTSFIQWAPATIIIRGFMGFLLGSLRHLFPTKPRHSELLAMIVAAVEKNMSYFLYDYFLFGPIAYLDLITFFPLSAIDIIVTLPILILLRRSLKIEYILE
jgi:uncharacterized membrane protein